MRQPLRGPRDLSTRKGFSKKYADPATIVGMDRFGPFTLSSQVYTNARDLVRLGLTRRRTAAIDKGHRCDQQRTTVA